MIVKKEGKARWITEATYAEVPAQARVAVNKMTEVISAANALVRSAMDMDKSEESVDDKYRQLFAHAKILMKTMEQNGCLEG